MSKLLSMMINDFPYGYTKLEYIQSSGTQYIDTGYTPTLNTKARVKFSPTSIENTGYFGSRIDPYRFCCTTFSSGTQFAFSVSNNSWSNNRTNLVLNQIYDCIAYNGKQIIDGTEYNETIVNSWGNCGTFRLGYLFVKNSDIYSNAKYYLCQIWENDILVRNLIPVRRTSDNEVGMYDLVNKVFYTNAGSGSFTGA